MVAHSEDSDATSEPHTRRMPVSKRSRRIMVQRTIPRSRSDIGSLNRTCRSLSRTKPSGQDYLRGGEFPLAIDQRGQAFTICSSQSFYASSCIALPKPGAEGAGQTWTICGAASSALHASRRRVLSNPAVSSLDEFDTEVSILLI